MTGDTTRRATAVIISSLLIIAAALAGCSSGASSKKALRFCTDATYPPAEFYQVTKNGSADLKRTIAGADIDIAREAAKRTNSKAQFKDTAFDKIIPALRDKKCDAIISFMNDTSARRQQVRFVDYLAAGQSVMLKTSARPVNSLADLAGRTVSVAKSTTEEDFLKQQSSSGTQFTIKSYDTVRSSKARSW
jgi:polar amino acid transport system substrate-binding protein